MEEPVRLTYARLYDQVARLAKSLREMGVTVGDRVAGFMPNMIETVVAMLAATSIGAIWSSCSPDFGVKGVYDRFGQIQPRVLFCANGYSYNGKTYDSLERVAGILKSWSAPPLSPPCPSTSGTIPTRRSTGAPTLTSIPTCGVTGITWRLPVPAA
ncbi:AMP-binding protein [Desulfofundulus salinus]|uniref:AMP-binding protein n=1 Tax=Desulfofundulus salinus TaxID=2419843 RepID=UPI001FAAAACD|nr:AMP-binding protein [Desulfofundulus salinum]